MPTVYLPAFLISIGTGMLVPVLPLYLREAGMSYSLVASVLAAFGFGAFAAQIPMGSVVARFGEFRVMVAATALLAGSTAMLGVTTVASFLAGMRVLGGVGSTGWILSRHSFMTTAVPVEVRGRISATFGGVNRFAYLLGPLLGGFVAGRAGFTTAFAVVGLVSALGIIPILTASDFERSLHSGEPAGLRPRTWQVLRTHRRDLAAVGSVQFGVIVAREGRNVVIPLLGAAMGLNVGSVGVLVAIGAASDLLLFPVAGWLMDRFGRLAAVVPSLSLFALGLFVAAAADSTGTLVLGAAIAGLGNGLGAGTMLTIGSDLAPQDDPSRFLALVGAARDGGRMMGPLIVGWMADLVGLPAGAVTLGVVALITAGLMVKVLGDTRAAAAAAGRE